jgi:hypothetical protein
MRINLFPRLDRLLIHSTAELTVALHILGPFDLFFNGCPGDSKKA